MGISYERGLGIEAVKDEALTWYRKAAGAGLTNAIEAVDRLEREAQ